MVGLVVSLDLAAAAGPTVQDRAARDPLSPAAAEKFYVISGKPPSVSRIFVLSWGPIKASEGAPAPRVVPDSRPWHLSCYLRENRLRLEEAGDPAVHFTPVGGRLLGLLAHSVVFLTLSQPLTLPAAETHGVSASFKMRYELGSTVLKRGQRVVLRLTPTTLECTPKKGPPFPVRLDAITQFGYDHVAWRRSKDVLESAPVPDRPLTPSDCEGMEGVAGCALVTAYLVTVLATAGVAHLFKGAQAFYPSRLARGRPGKRGMVQGRRA